MKTWFKTIFIPTICILLGGIFIVAIAWMIYLGIYLSLEALFYPTNPQAVPADYIRIVCAVLFILSYLFILRSHASQTMKAMIFVGPLTTLVITLILSFYTHLILVSILLAVMVILILGLIRHYKRGWVFYLATLYSLLLGVAYALPW